MSVQAIFSGKWPSATFSDPVDTYDGSQPQEVVAFCSRNTGRHIIGALSYDFGLTIHGLKSRHAGFAPRAILAAFDGSSERRNAHESEPLGEVQNGMSHDEYAAKVSSVKDQIRHGNVYQLNLAQKISARCDSVDGFSLFCSLESNYADNLLTYLKFDDFELISASPERFLRISNGRIQTEPIKGTRPRRDGAEDDAMRDELKASEKEQAELNMITDLLRNDLAGVCQTGTVKVAEPRTITAHEKVWHANSRISGRLRPELSPIETLLECFPGGSITGCPKLSAMKLIDEFETVPRGFYTGTIFRIDPEGNLDSSIAIRTLELANDSLQLGIGSGIVADSDPDSEWQETLSKAYILNSLSAKITDNA